MSNINPRLAVKKLKMLCFTSKSNLLDFRKAIDKTFSLLFLPNKVDCRRMLTAGVICDMFIPELCAKNRMILYIHGGSFVGGSCDAWHSFCASLAHESSTRILLPQIRLAPEFPFPSALEDAKEVFNRMYEKIPHIYLAADASGASIALALFLQLSAKQQEVVKGITLFSPWLDISSSAAAVMMNPRKNFDPVMNPDVLKACAPLYTYTKNFSNPLVSPMYAQEQTLREFPPVFIQAGGNELLLPDIQRFAKKLNDSGTNCTLDIWPDMCHLFQFIEEYTGDAHIAVARAGGFIKNTAKTLNENDEDIEDLL